MPDRASREETAQRESIVIDCEWMCGICSAVCREDAITSEAGRVRVDRGRCSRCKVCVRLCPAGILKDGTFEGL